MSEYLTKDYVYINSFQRTTGTSSNFTIDLSQQITIPNNYNHVVILSGCLPKSYYLINNNNKTFYFYESDSINKKYITLPIGNYTFSQLMTQLNLSISTGGLTNSYTVTGNTQLGKITIQQTNGIDASVIGFDKLSPYKILGFSLGNYNLSGIPSNYILTSQNVVNLQLTSGININSDMVEKGILGTFIPNETDFSNIIFIEREPILSSKKYLSNTAFTYSIWLTDLITGDPIDLNGIDWQFAICIYQRNHYYSIMLEDHKLKLLQEELNNNQLTDEQLNKN